MGEQNLEKMKKVGHGGRREKSGRKPKKEKVKARGIKEVVEKHFGEEVKIRIVDPKTGTSMIVSKPRVLRMLEVLYDQAVAGSAEAANKWLDRALGKPAQHMSFEDIKPEPEDIKKAKKSMAELIDDLRRTFGN